MAPMIRATSFSETGSGVVAVLIGCPLFAFLGIEASLVASEVLDREVVGFFAPQLVELGFGLVAELLGLFVSLFEVNVGGGLPVFSHPFFREVGGTGDLALVGQQLLGVNLAVVPVGPGQFGPANGHVVVFQEVDSPAVRSAAVGIDAGVGDHPDVQGLPFGFGLVSFGYDGTSHSTSNHESRDVDKLFSLVDGVDSQHFALARLVGDVHFGLSDLLAGRQADVSESFLVLFGLSGRYGFVQQADQGFFPLVAQTDLAFTLGDPAHHFLVVLGGDVDQVFQVVSGVLG